MKPARAPSAALVVAVATVAVADAAVTAAAVVVADAAAGDNFRWLTSPLLDPNAR
jgi:hypothetical protein